MYFIRHNKSKLVIIEPNIALLNNGLNIIAIDLDTSKLEFRTL